jgi:hypothetical protein
MSFKPYEGRMVKIVVFNDITADERVLEFYDPAISEGEPAVAVANSGAAWNDAKLSTNPRIDGVPVDFLAWVLQTARDMTEVS